MLGPGFVFLTFSCFLIVTRQLLQLQIASVNMTVFSEGTWGYRIDFSVCSSLLLLQRKTSQELPQKTSPLSQQQRTSTKQKSIAVFSLHCGRCRRKLGLSGDGLLECLSEHLSLAPHHLQTLFLPKRHCR